jgi:type I restriction enzyme S subunit
MNLKESQFEAGSLPKGWVWTTLKDVCLQPQYGWTTSAAQQGRLRLLRTTDITSGKINWECVPFCEKEPDDKSKYLLGDGDIVISRAGSVGFSLLIRNPKESVFASYLIRFKPLIDKDYTAYFLKTPAYWGAISEKKLGIALANVNATKLKEISIPVAPLNEQRRIVSKIEELFTRLDAGVEALKKVKAELKRYRQAVLKYAFEGKLTAEWREKNKDKLEPASKLLERIKKDLACNVDFKLKVIPSLEVNELPNIPVEWKSVRIGEIANVVRGASPRPAGSPKYFGGSIPWITVREITKDDNMFLTNVSSFVTELGKERSRFIEEETFLLTNSGATLGVPKITKIGGCINDGSVALQGLNNTLRMFLYYFLSSLTTRLRQLNQGAAQPNLNTGIVTAIKVPLPPEKEQETIVEEIERHFSITDEVEQTIEKCLKESARLRQSILKRAFEGKLVPQDPSDEPAEKLLERIKAEKRNSERKLKFVKD